MRFGWQRPQPSCIALVELRSNCVVNPSAFKRAKLGAALAQRTVAPHFYESEAEAKAHLLSPSRNHRPVLRPRTAMPKMRLVDHPVQTRMHATCAGAPMTRAVAHPCDEGSLRGAIESWLVGPVAHMQALADSLGLTLVAEVQRAAQRTVPRA